MKIICMDCHNETHLEVEMLKDKKKMTCARCEENSQATPAGSLDGWSATPRFEEPKVSEPAADYAFEVLQPEVNEVDVLEIPEKSLELYNPERAESEDFILYEPEVAPAVEEPLAEQAEEEPDVLFFSQVEKNPEPPPIELGLVDGSTPREEPAPVQFIEVAAPPAEAAAPGKVKLLKFSTASLAAGLTVFLAFIFLGDTFLKSSGGDTAQVTAAPRPAKEAVRETNQQGAAVIEAAPAPQPSPTPAPTPEPTQAPTPEPTPAPEPKQAETPAPPAETQQSAAAGRFAVQVGSYNEVGQANERAEKLRAAGYDPRVVSVELPKRGTWFRVMVGSFSDRAEASRFGTQLRAKGAAQDFVIGEL